jgi:hypothetical protein
LVLSFFCIAFPLFTLFLVLLLPHPLFYSLLPPLLLPHPFCLPFFFISNNLRVASARPSGGALADADAASFLPQLLQKRASLHATTLRGRPPAYKASLVARFRAEALPALASGTVGESALRRSGAETGHEKVATQ